MFVVIVVMVMVMMALKVSRPDILKQKGPSVTVTGTYTPMNPIPHRVQCYPQDIISTVEDGPEKDAVIMKNSNL